MRSPQSVDRIPDDREFVLRGILLHDSGPTVGDERRLCDKSASIGFCDVGRHHTAATNAIVGDKNLIPEYLYSRRSVRLFLALLTSGSWAYGTIRREMVTGSGTTCSMKNIRQNESSRIEITISLVCDGAGPDRSRSVLDTSTKPSGVNRDAQGERLEKLKRLLRAGLAADLLSGRVRTVAA